MLEGTSGSVWSSLLFQAGSPVRSDQGAQCFARLGLENLQGWRLHSLAGQPVPLPGYTLAEKVSSYMLSETLLFQLTPIVSCSPTMDHCEEPSSIFSVTSP